MFMFSTVIHFVWMISRRMQACQHRPQKTFLVTVAHVDGTVFVCNEFGDGDETGTVKWTEFCDSQGKFYYTFDGETTSA